MTIAKIACNIKAERSLLGMIINENKLFYEISGMRLKSNEFYDDFHRDLWEKIIEASSENIDFDMISLATSMGRDDGIKLLNITESAPISQNLKHFAIEIRAQASVRAASFMLESIRSKISNHGSYSNLTSLRIAISDLNEMINNRARDESKTVSAGDAMISMIDKIEDRIESHDKGIPIGVPSGFKMIDGLLTGFQPSALYFLAARPSMGKTALALNFVKNAAHAGNKIIYFSMEMTKDQISDRLVSSDGIISLQRIKTGNLTESDLNKINFSTNRIAKTKLKINDASDLTFDELITEIRYLVKKDGLEMVTVDYLTLIDFEDQGRENYSRTLAKATRRLKILAKDLKIPILMLAQLNRDIEKSHKPRPPRMSDLADSSSIEKDADCIMFVDRPSMYIENADESESYLHVVKNRDGKTGVIPLKNNMSLCSFYDV